MKKTKKAVSCFCYCTELNEHFYLEAASLKINQLEQAKIVFKAPQSIVLP